MGRWECVKGCFLYPRESATIKCYFTTVTQAAAASFSSEEVKWMNLWRTVLKNKLLFNYSGVHSTRGSTPLLFHLISRTSFEDHRELYATGRQERIIIN